MKTSWVVFVFVATASLVACGVGDSSPCAPFETIAADSAFGRELEDLKDECAADGATCPEDGYIGIQDAYCIAREYGLGQGLTGMEGDLVYHNALRAIVWNIRITTEVPSSPGDETRGDGITIDAWSGNVEESWRWSEVP